MFILKIYKKFKFLLFIKRNKKEKIKYWNYNEIKRKLRISIEELSKIQISFIYSTKKKITNGKIGKLKENSNFFLFLKSEEREFYKNYK